jgi:hypothetical protein
MINDLAVLGATVVSPDGQASRGNHIADFLVGGLFNLFRCAVVHA